jgi:hypothetical protein
MRFITALGSDVQIAVPVPPGSRSSTDRNLEPQAFDALCQRIGMKLVDQS